MVSIHKVPVIVYLIIRAIYLTFRFKRGTAMPRSKLKVLGKPEYTNVVIAAHAICVRTTMPPLVFVENFLGFQLQDKHNASILFQMSLDRLLHPTANVQKLFQI